MKRVFNKLCAAALSLIMLVSLAACGGGGEQTDPNAGIYTAVYGEMLGIEVEASEIFEDGFTIELRDNGKCVMKIDGESAKGKWTLDGTDFTIKGGGLDSSGWLEDGALYLENVMDMGVSLLFYSEEMQEQLDEIFSGVNFDDLDDEDDDYEPEEEDDAAYVEEDAPVAEDEPMLEEPAPIDEPDEEVDTVSSIWPQPGTSWYGCISSEEIEHYADVWAIVDIDTTGKLFFQMYETYEAFLGETDDIALMSMYIEPSSYGFLPIADGEAWFLDHDIAEDEIFEYMGINFDGAIYFTFEFEFIEDFFISFEIFLRENGAEWDLETDLIPPGYETFKDGF